MNARGKVADIVLFLLIVLNILDFFRILPGDMDFAKKVISWTVLALLFYKVHFTWLFLGSKRNLGKNHLLDVLILLSFLILAFKSVIAVAIVTVEEASLFHGLLNAIILFREPLQAWSFYIGGIGVLLLSIILAFKPIQEKSLLGNWHIHKRNILVRFVAIFLTLVGFFVLVFDLLLEWLVIAVDSLMIIIGLAVYIYIIARRHKHYATHRFIHRVGSFGEGFEEKFLNFFHDDKHVWLGITGLFVLHLVTEIANFLLPYIYINNSFYFAYLHLTPLLPLFLQDIQAANVFLVGSAYLLNIIALLALTILPAYLWYEVYTDRVKRLPGWLNGVVFASLVTFVLAPLFSFVALKEGELIGVNILAQSVASSSLLYVVLGSVIFGLFMYALSFANLMKKAQYHIIMLGVVIFLFSYMALFYVSTINYFTTTIAFLLQNSMYFILSFILLFFGIKVLFFVFGSIKFLVQIVRHHVL